MKLTTRFRYGTRAVLDLSLHSAQRPVSIKEIAERQELSQKYLENLFSTLQSAGIIRSIRGPQGGYQLSRKPEEISLKILYDILEGATPLSDCTADPTVCNRSESCVTKQVWAEMYHRSMDYLEGITLRTLMDSMENMQTTASGYQI